MQIKLHQTFNDKNNLKKMNESKVLQIIDNNKEEGEEEEGACVCVYVALSCCPRSWPDAQDHHHALIAPPCAPPSPS